MQTHYHAHGYKLRNSLVYDEYHIYDYYRVNGLVTPIKAARAEKPVHSPDQQSCSPCRPANPQDGSIWTFSAPLA